MGLHMETREEKEASEFGKGLVICLVKFAEHMGNWQSQKESYKQMIKENPELFTESYAVKMHFNAASDHLYEIEVPEMERDSLIGKKVAELKTLALEMRQIFNNKEYTEKDLFALYDLCEEIALLIDEQIGLKPEKGEC
jgi:hypothetical protein